MKKIRLLTLLALLLTAATGAWAQDAKHLITATYFEKTRSLEQPLPYATTVGALYEAVTGESFSDLISTMSALNMTLTGISSINTSVVSIGEFNGASTPVTVNADGKAAVALIFGSYVQGIFVTVTPPLYVTMKDGTEDAGKWTAKVGEGEAQALPIGGLKGDGSETVTLQYNGRLKVKSVTATTDAATAPAGITVARAAYQGTNAPSQDWKAGDKLYVYSPGLVLMGTLVAEADGAEAFMAGKLDFTKTGTTAPMTLTLSNLPLPMDYSTQDGKLSTINSTMNYAMATVTATAIDSEAGTVTLDATPTLVPQQALVKFTLQDAGGTAINVSSLFVNLDNATYNYSTINQLRLDVSNEGAGDWNNGGATYENGVITLPKAGGCGCGWKPELWEGVDLTKYTGIICEFANPVEGDCQFFVAYMIEGDQDQHYSGTSVSDGATYAWVGVPSDAIQINRIYFALNNVVDNDVKVYPGRLNLAKIGGYILHPNASEVYVTFNGTEPNAKLTLDAAAGNKDYIYRATGVTYAEGFYYEQIVRMVPSN